MESSVCALDKGEVNNILVGRTAPVLILAFLVTLFLGLMFGPDNAVMVAIFNYIQLPIETSLMALLAISLVIAGYRIVAARKDLSSLIFIGTGVCDSPGDRTLGCRQRQRIADNVWRDTKLARSGLGGWEGQGGILLGVALGSIVTGTAGIACSRSTLRGMIHG